MSYTFNSLKPFSGPVIAIKRPLKLLLLGVFIVSGLLFVNQAVLGITTYFDFDSYATGTIIGQDNWEGIGTPDISDIQATSGTQSLYFDQCGGVEYAKRVLDFEFTGFNYWYFPKGSATRIPYWRFYDVDDNLLFYKSLGDSNLAVDTWHFWNVEIDFDNFLFKETNEATSTGWISWQNATNSIDYIIINGTGATPCQIFIDNLNFVVECSSFESYLTCENAGCFWSYSTGLGQNFCSDVNPDLCGSSLIACSNCLDQTTCQAETFCYWNEDQNLCKFGTGSCNPGLELQFCEAQNECENAGGYWYSDFCWLSPQFELTSWEDYYDLYGDYATPSAWINNMASNTSLFFGQIGGFLSVFEENFDLMEAYERGKNFGEVIPQARGYLTIFNNFLGGFPIGEFFVFLLIFMLAVGVFRIIRNIFQLIKFW